jgi:hypothetical protein
MARGRGGLGLNKYIVPIVLIGGVGIVAYFIFTKSTGGKEALGTLGGFLKNATDAINSTGVAIGGTSNALQNAPKSVASRLQALLDDTNRNVDADVARKKQAYKEGADRWGAIGESILGTGNAIQQFFGGGTRAPTIASNALARGNRILNRKAPTKMLNNTRLYY